MADKKKILIADDDKSFIEVLEMRLESAGFDVIYAYEGVRTIELAMREKPHLVLLDWKMPVGGGENVLQSLRQQNETKHIPVIVISGVEDADIETKARSLGAKAFIKKPYESRLLLDTIKEILASKR